MTLAWRLLLAFVFVALCATGLVGASVRESSRELIEAEFDERIAHAESGVRLELAHEAQDLKDLIPPLCDHDTFFDRLHLALEKTKGNTDALDSETWIALRNFVPDEAQARRLDDLVLFIGSGMILGASDVARIGTKDARLGSIWKTPAATLVMRPGGEPTMEVYCARGTGGVSLGLLGARRISKIIEHVGKANAVALRVLGEGEQAAASDADALSRGIEIQEVKGLRLAARVSKDELKVALVKLDAQILYAGATAIGLAILIAFLLARTISRPIVALAAETRAVVGGEPRQVKARGGKEIATLADAFNHAIAELSAMKKRLAATERIAARREVARQIAHEIKNPLAPIRAAVETLRRLRAREDPAFDDYFEEATATVLEEVHRIANIVTEFTRFNRLPPPNPEPIDLAAVARGVVNLHAHIPDLDATSPKIRVELQAEALPQVSADRDQIVQVLTNLIQNGLDAASASRPDPRVLVSLDKQPNDRVRIVVRDNGPGVPDEMMNRLFEPYATTKAKGTGLGLAIVQRIVFEHGGEIAYRKGTKGGAVFEILLPIAGPPLLERPPAVDQTGKPQESERKPKGS